MSDDLKIGYSIYCAQCHQMAAVKYGKLCAACEIERLRAVEQAHCQAASDDKAAIKRLRSRHVAAEADLEAEQVVTQRLRRDITALHEEIKSLYRCLEQASVTTMQIISSQNQAIARIGRERDAYRMAGAMLWLHARDECSHIDCGLVVSEPQAFADIDREAEKCLADECQQKAGVNDETKRNGVSG